jgi:hypothetical protein
LLPQCFLNPSERELVPLVEAMTLVDEVAGAVMARVNAIPSATAASSQLPVADQPF